MPYLIFDIEGRISYERVMRTEKLTSIDGSMRAAVDAFLAKACEEKDTNNRACFAPARFHEPVLVVILLVADDMSYMHHEVIDANDHGNPKVAVICARFWQMLQWAQNSAPGTRLVGFNSCRYDIPVLEVTAIERNIPLGFWFNPDAKIWENGRTDKATFVHMDLLPVLTSPSYMGGSLSFWSRLIGLPGKLDTEGDMVQAMLERKEIAQIGDYCICDVLNTYGLLFHILFSTGRLSAGPIGNPVFIATMDRVIDGRGPETTRYRVAATGVPF